MSAFRVRLAKSGREYTIPDGRSIVQVLHEAGVDLPTSCEEGICGTCRTSYLEGEPEHLRNYIDFAAYGRDARMSGDMDFVRFKGDLYVFHSI